MLRDPNLVPLSRQHQHGLALCVLTDRALGADRGPESIACLARKVVDAYDVELSNHFQVEEQILFPAFPRPLVEELVAQHRQLEAMVERLRAEPSAPALEEFTVLLRSHIRLEENELFEEMQRELPRETLDALGRQIEENVVRVCL